MSKFTDDKLGPSGVFGSHVPATIRVLGILSRGGDMMPSEVAREYFDRNNPIWRKHYKCGGGTTRGMGARTWAGGFLGKMAKKNLVLSLIDGTYRITDTGLDLLSEFGGAHDPS